jgi:hypothetical protein
MTGRLQRQSRRQKSWGTRRRIVLVCACVLALELGFASGCAAPAAPQPPTLALPQPVHDLSAKRSGENVALSWTMPTRTTDKLPLKGPVIAEICRRERNGPCDLLPEQRFAADAVASYNDLLPQRLTSGDARLLTYTVALKNHAGKSAGASNAAFTAGGAAPPAIQGLRAQVRADGVVLSWKPATANAATANPAAAGAVDSRWAARIERTLVSAPAVNAIPNLAPKEVPATKGASTGGAAEREQVLLVTANARAGLQQGPGVQQAPALQQAPGLQQALDRTAVFGETYRYRVARQEELDLDGHKVTTWGPPSPLVTVEVKDVFPPAVPADLAAVADAAAHAIDLSWTPGTTPGTTPNTTPDTTPDAQTDAGTGTQPDLAGYIVYRRTVGASGSAGLPQQISPAGAPVETPAFRDSNAQPGERYAYSVAAVDVRGNQSQRSAEAEESLPSSENPQ